MMSMLNVSQYSQEAALYSSFVVIQDNYHPLFKLLDDLQGPLQDMGRSYVDPVIEGCYNVIL